MVMIPWNTPVKPAAPVANQLFVDDQKAVWQWDATLQSWQRRPHMYLQELEHMSLYTWWRSWFSLMGNVYPPILSAQWANIYSKTFCEFSFPITGTPSVYLSHPSGFEGDFRAAVRSNTPHNGSFNDECNVRIMQVVDPEIDIAKTSHHNFIYSNFRGREAFNRNKGREAVGLPYTCGYPDKFRSGLGYFSDAYTDPWFQLMEEFHGITPDPDPLGHMIVWSRKHKNQGLFHQPKIGSVVNSGERGRYAWDRATGSTVAVYNRLFAIGYPKIMILSFFAPTSRYVEDMSALPGASYLLRNGSAMIIYPLSLADPDPAHMKYAFYVKPLGVDSFGFGYNPFSTPMRLVMEKVFGDGHIRRKMVDHTASYCRGGYDECDVVTGFDIRMFGFQIPQGARQQDPGLPDYVQFYLYDSDSGRRSETIRKKYKIVRNQCNITTCLEPYGT